MITKCSRTLYRIAIVSLVSVAALIATPHGAQSQDAATTGEAPQPAAVPVVEIVKTDVAQAKIEALKAQLAAAAKKFTTNNLSDNDYTDLAQEVLAINDEADRIVRDFQPRVKSIERRLAELQPTNDDGEQSETAKLEEASQRAVLSELGGVLQQAQVIAIQVADLTLTITQKRRMRFTERLFHREKSTLDPAFWSEVTVSVPRLVWRLELWVSKWRKEASLGLDRALVAIFIGALFATIFVIVRSRTYILKRIARDPAVEPRKAQRITAALFITMVNFGSAAIISVLFYLVFDGLGLVPEPFNTLTATFFAAFTVFMLIIGLSRALFAPGRANWRLVPVNAASSGSIASIAQIGGGIVAMAIMSEAVTEVLAIPVPITIAARALLTALIAMVCLLGLRVMSRRPAGDADGMAPDDKNSLLRLILPVVWVVSLVALIAPVFGYVALGWFLASQLVFTALVGGVLFLLMAVVEESTTSGFQAGYPVGNLLTGVFGFSPQGSEQLGVLAGGASKLVLLGFALIGFLVPWGLTSSDISRIEGMVTRVRFGDVTISLATILSTIVIFAVGFMATRAVQGWLENRYLPKTGLDVGLKTLISTGLGYVGIVIAAMLAFAHLGVQMENLALVAGALSVGIGFGLQSIVSNFVSGLILLAERPIRTGDWVVVAGEHGTVRKINVRSTEIETFDRATMIVPNSDLISGVVKNWVLNDNTGRIIIPLGVDYASDPEHVRQVLLECARGNLLVLAHPEPVVLFVNFGDSALEFELRCYLSDIGMGLTVRSDIRFEITRRFREEGIQMPFPQRVVHMRGQTGAAAVEDAALLPARAKPSKQPVPRDAEGGEDASAS